MKLEDAIKSGKRIGRTDNIGYSFHYSTIHAPFTSEDVLGDWEVEEEKLMIKRSDIEEALKAWVSFEFEYYQQEIDNVIKHLGFSPK